MEEWHPPELAVVTSFDSWGSEEVCSMLEEWGFSEALVSAFETRRIQGRLLLLLTDAELAQMGLSPMDRVAFYSFLQSITRGVVRVSAVPLSQAAVSLAAVRAPVDKAPMSSADEDAAAIVAAIREADACGDLRDRGMAWQALLPRLERCLRFHPGPTLARTERWAARADPVRRQPAPQPTSLGSGTDGRRVPGGDDLAGRPSARRPLLRCHRAAMLPR